MFRSCILLVAAASLCSCESVLKERAETAVSIPSAEGVRFSAPRLAGSDTARWTEIPRQDGKEYAQSKGGAEDVISFYGFTTDLMAEIRTLDDLEKMLRATGKFSVLRRDTIRGVPALRFEKLTEGETGDLPARLRTGLGLGARPSDTTYATRAHGAFFMKSGPTPKMITVACSRTNQSGVIGSYFEELLEDYLSVFTSENVLR